MRDLQEKNRLLSCHIDELDKILDETRVSNKTIEKCISKVFCKNPEKISAKIYYYNLCFTGLYRLLRLLENVIRCVLTCFFILLFVYLFIISHNSVQKFVMRNCQNYIYPTMRALRLWTLPLLHKYEFLSDWHEEECLIKNPFYYELPLDCWPCEEIRTLVDLSGFHNYSHDYILNEQPFIIRDSLQDTVSFSDLQTVYKEYELYLDRGISKFLCSERDFCFPRDVFKKGIPDKNDFHVLWKINRVAAARIVRKIFPRPYFIPNNSEVALERFLYLSGAEAPQFFLPLTDFANVWVAQGQGYRLIVLDPSEPCASNCSTVSVLLRPRDVLYYNWQFWRPRSRPANLCDEMSITFVGSFY